VAVNPLRKGWPVLAAILAAVALAQLHGDGLRTGFLNDDHLFLEEARGRSLAESLTRLGALGNFYRPLSRQLYFEALAPIGGGQPWLFHLFNFAVYLVALALLYRLLRELAPRGGAMAGALFFAVLPFQSVNLTWISCSQDLLALGFALGAFESHRRGRRWPAAALALAAFASKESALPLAAALVAWDLLVRGDRLPAALRRAAPTLLATALWATVLVAMRLAHPAAAAFVRFGPGDFAAGYVHAVQSLLGLDHPSGFVDSLLRNGPALLPLALLAALALWVEDTGATAGPEGGKAALKRAAPGALPPPRAVLRFALAWILAFAFVTGPVAHSWSAYYYTLTAVGGAVLVALAARRIDRWAWLVLCAGLLWWHAGGSSVRAFAVADDAWVGTSHLTAFYFRRAAAITDSMSRQLVRLEPRPPAGTVFFFATLPPFAGFQMGNGALIRSLYRDPSLTSHFYSQYSESTAAERPARILFWDGRALVSLYGANVPDPLFQVGTDLLLLDRPAGAAHAFRRGLAAGGRPEDHLYWLGWAYLWQDRRELAEQVWTSWGARDDSAGWHWKLREVNTEYVTTRDTLHMRRLLLEALQLGIGRPEAHATLASLLEPRSPKYAALEYKVAAWLDPRDPFSVLGLSRTLAGARLDDGAWAAFEELERRDPGWRRDPAVVRLHDELAARRPAAVRVMEFP
jgi:hypothetical protein